MVFVRMREHEAQQIFAPFGDEARVRHDHVDAAAAAFAEGHAEIDHQPLAAVAVEIEIHPDLARTAERQEIEARIAAHGLRFMA